MRLSQQTFAHQMAASPPAASLATAPGVDEQLVATLLAEGVWRPLHLSDKVDAATTDEARRAAENHAYLEREVLPTLVPGLHDLLEQVQRKVELGDAAKPKSGCISAAHPTGASNPIDWLAQYLMRNNHRRAAAAADNLLESHPYGVLYRAQERQRIAQPPSKAAKSLRGGTA